MLRNDPPLVIARRYNGPPDSANGGYACGLLAARSAAHLGSRIAVALHAPPPLDTELDVKADGHRVHLWNGPVLLATAAAALQRTDPPPPPPLDNDEIDLAASAYEGGTDHPFPTCFVCGVEESGGDALGLRPGPVRGRPGTVACRWTPPARSAEIPEEIVWSVLDCPCGWTSDAALRPMVLTWMTVEISALPRPGGRYVVTAELLRQQKRTAQSRAVLYDERTRRPLAHATTVWTSVA